MTRVHESQQAEESWLRSVGWSDREAAALAREAWLRGYDSAMKMPEEAIRAACGLAYGTRTEASVQAERVKS